MNINVTLPPLIPTQLQPQVEAARTDNRRAELIPQARQGQASSAESEVGSQKEKSKASQAANSNPATQSGREGSQATVQHSFDHRFVEATGEDGQRKQQEQQKQQQQQELQQVQGLVERDQEVRAHEQAHLAVGGAYAGSPTYQFTLGPDGKRYATGGEVSIDTSDVPGEPAATIAKMQQIRAAALAPAEPSAQDLSVARSAAAGEAKARKALMADDAASGGVLSAYMDKRSQVIAGHYQHVVTPAASQSFSVRA